MVFVDFPLKSPGFFRSIRYQSARNEPSSPSFSRCREHMGQNGTDPGGGQVEPRTSNAGAGWISVLHYRHFRCFFFFFSTRQLKSLIWNSAIFTGFQQCCDCKLMYSVKRRSLKNSGVLFVVDEANNSFMTKINVGPLGLQNQKFSLN